MSQDNCFINGDLLRLRREASGWVLNDMAMRACMSVKQIRQLEEGGTSAFYSPSVKVTAAKRVGALLGLSPEEVLVQVADVPKLDERALDTDAVSIDRRLAGHEALGQETAHVASSSQPSLSGADNAKSKTSLWVIAGLFAAALAVAAYMQPQDEPVGETEPPLQVVPSDASEPASAAEEPPAAAMASSAASFISVAPKPIASAPAPVASANQAP